MGGCGCGGVGGPFVCLICFQIASILTFVRCPIIRSGESVVINSTVCSASGGQVCKAIESTLFIFVKRLGGSDHRVCLSLYALQA